MALPVELAFYQPAVDTGWRVALYPPGTALAAAAASEISKQATRGYTVDPATCRLLPNYFIRGTSDTLVDDERNSDSDHGWRNAPVLFGTVCLQYRLAGPGVHNP